MALHNGPDHLDEVDLPDEDELRELYLEEGLTREETAEALDTSVHAVRKGIMTYGLHKQDSHGPTVGLAAELAKAGEEATENDETDDE